MAEQPNIIKTALFSTQEEKDDYAIEFSVWIRRNAVEVFNGWQFEGKFYDDEQLLEIFKKKRIMKTLKIEIPNGFEIDKENSTFEQIVFKEIKQLPESWEELEIIEGYFVQGRDSECCHVKKHATSENKNIFSTEEQAKASIALSQLSQLREVYRNGWVPDWEDSTNKYIISFRDNDIIYTSEYQRFNKFLSFQDEQTRDLFLENFKDLIEQAKPLIS
jgi:hypothetical protein